MSYASTSNSSRWRIIFWLGVVLSMAGFYSAVHAATRIDDPQNFKKCWDYRATPNLGVRMAADATQVYFVDTGNHLQSVDLASGNKIWSSELGGEVVSNVQVRDDVVFVVTASQTGPDTSGKAILHALSRQTGITEWRVDLTTSSPVYWIGSVGSQVVVVASEGAVLAFDRVERKLAWKVDLTTSISSEPIFSEAGIEIGTKNNELLRVSGNPGKVRAIWKAEFLPTATLTDSGGRSLIGDERGNVTLISSEGNRMWVFKNGAQISAASAYGSEYLVASYDNFLYMLARNGGVRWKRRLSGRAGDAPLILRGAAVVPIIGTGSVYVLDLKNGKISNRIGIGDEDSLRVIRTTDTGFVVAGPAGLSHFTDKCPAK